MSGYHKRKYNDFEPFPVHKLKRVDRPTTLIFDDKIQRAHEGEQGFNRAYMADFGPAIKKT